MTRTLVESSQISAVAYDAVAWCVEIEFKPKKNGDRDVWNYFGVAPEVYSELVDAPSIGRAFGSKIKGVYSGRKVATILADGTTVTL